ncbi:MAG: 4Fe-4S binding protein [Anaerolineae bacterium]|jgi:formate hydrogenlyase subunit 6/NADH:ubiquinone oxidoreductase subunit I
MLRLRSIIYLLPDLIHTLFTRRTTVRYPFEPLELPSYFRGRIVVDAEQCRGCGACVRDCPSTGLRLRRDEHGGYRLLHYPDCCANCGQCEASCPTGALRLVSAYVAPTHAREELVETLVERNRELKRSDTSQARPSL